MSNKEIPVVSVEKARSFSSMHTFALDALRNHKITTEKNHSSKSQLEEYQELTASKLSPAKYLKLRAWLKGNDLYSKKHASYKLNDEVARSNEEIERSDTLLSKELDRFREDHLKRYTPFAKERFQKLVFANGLPSPIAEAYEESDVGSIVDWLVRKPEENKPGASDEQLADLLEWNMQKTEEIAQNPEIVHSLIDDYFDNVQHAINDGRLHSDWAEQTAKVDEVVIGDIFDMRFVGHNDRVRSGAYSEEKKGLIVWPYEPGDEPLSPNVFSHEMTHSMGGMKTGWLGEALTEKLTGVINEYDPLELEFIAYEDGQHIVDNLIKNAPEKITYLDISKCYVGDDKEKNEQELLSLFKRAYQGYDVLGTAIKVGETVVPEEAPNGSEKEVSKVASIDYATTEVILLSLAAVGGLNLAPTDAAKVMLDLANKETNEIRRAAYIHCAQMFADKKNAPV